MASKQPQIIDLFAGAGGLSLGAARAGFALPLAVELDRDAKATHALNFPGTKHLGADLSSVSGADLLANAGLAKGKLDGLIGGPPCQGFSIMGKRNAGDPRNDLFVKFFDLVRECQPQFFVAENVPGILADKFSSIREEAFNFVADDYVLSEPIRFKASDFGAPTNRDRVFFIGYRSRSASKFTSGDFDAQKSTTPVTVGAALEGLPSDINSDWLTEELSWRPVTRLSDSRFSDQVQGKIPHGAGNIEAVARFLELNHVWGCFGTRHSVEVEERYRNLQPGKKDSVSRSVRLKLDGFCPTLRAGTGSERGRRQAVRPIHPTLPRVITPREAARLQGFPDWFRFAPSKWQSFRQIGNSVSPILSEAIFRVIFNQLYSI